MAAAVACELHTAMFAPRPEARNIKFFFRYWHSPCVAEFEIDGLPLVAEPRAVCLLTLQASLNLISLSVLYKSPSRSAEYKSHVIFLTLIVQVLYPFVVAGSCTAVQKSRHIPHTHRAGSLPIRSGRVVHRRNFLRRRVPVQSVLQEGIPES